MDRHKQIDVSFNERACLSLVAAFLTSIPLIAAAETVFPNADGSYDLASANAWGALPDSTLDARIAAAGTYTVVSNVSFKSLYATANNVVIDLTQELARYGCPTVALYSTGEAFAARGSDSSVTVKGGFWNFNGGNIQQSGYYAANNSSITLDDGAVMTNVSKVFNAGYSQSGRKITLKGKSKLYTKYFVMANTTGTNGRLSVLDGSTLVWGIGGDGSDYFATEMSGDSASAKNGVLVSGTNTLMRGYTNLRIGARSDDWLVVSNAAELTTSSEARIGINGNARRARVMVADGAMFQASAIKVGDATGTAYNRFEVLDGAYVRTSSKFYVGGYQAKSTNNRAVVSNAVLSVDSVLVSSAGGTSNALWIVGDTACLTTRTTTVSSIFPNSVSGEILIDRGLWRTEGSLQFASKESTQSSNNVLRLERGGSLVCAGSVKLGASSTTKCRNNLTFVGDGCILKSRSAIELTSPENTLVVSNGTVESTSTSVDNWTMGGIQIGYCRTAGTDTGTNDVLVLQGSRPQIKSAGQMTIRETSTVRFVLPETGLADDVTPLTAVNMRFCSPLTLEADVAAYRMAHGKRTRITLATASNALTLPDDIIETANNSAAAIEGKYRFVKSGKSLLLEVAGSGGMTLIIY